MHRHGPAAGGGAYSREKMYLLHTVVSTYESQDIIKLVCDIDPGAVINVFHALDLDVYKRQMRNRGDVLHAAHRSENRARHLFVFHSMPPIRLDFDNG